MIDDAEVLDTARVVRTLPPEGQRHVREALRDRVARRHVIKLLQSYDPASALARQAESDVAEYVQSTGRPVVFKSIAATVGPRVRSALDALVEAMPYHATEDGRDSLEIAASADDPVFALTEHFKMIVTDAMAPGSVPELNELGAFDSEAEAMEMYGLGMSAKWKKILKVGAVVVGAVVAVSAVMATGGAAMPALGGAMKFLGGGVSGGIGSIFGGGGAPGTTTNITSSMPGGAGGSGFNPASLISPFMNLINRPGILPVRAPAPAPAQPPMYAQPQTIMMPGQTQYVPQATGPAQLIQAPAAPSAETTIVSGVPNWALMAGGAAILLGVGYAMTGGGRKSRR